MFKTPSPEASQPPEKTKRGLGLLGIFGLMMGGGSLLFALAGVINTAYELELSFRLYGSRVELPDSYDVCWGLGAAGVLFIVLSCFGSFVTGKFMNAKGKPLVRIAIVVAALALLIVAGRGLQIVALTQTYGSMLAYYATDGDLEDVKAELAKKPDREALDRAVWRSAQYNNAPALKLLLKAGADFQGKSKPKKQRKCALGDWGVGPEFVKVAIEHEIKPKTCPNSKTLIWTIVNRAQHDPNTDDAKAAKIVALLSKGGWSPIRAPKGKKKPFELATERGMTKTAKALKKAT